MMSRLEGLFTLLMQWKGFIGKSVKLPLRRAVKTKGAFPNDMALLKLIYLAVENISQKWTSPLQNWALTAQQLHIKFGDRMRMDL